MIGFITVPTARKCFKSERLKLERAKRAPKGVKSGHWTVNRRNAGHGYCPLSRLNPFGA